MNAAAGNPHAAIRYNSLIGGEAVPIDLRVARIGSRTIAFALDLVIELIVSGVLLGIVAGIGLESAAEAAVDLAVVVLVFFGYPTVLETAWGGRTVGKAAMGLRATRDDGGPVRFSPRFGAFADPLSRRRIAGPARVGRCHQHAGVQPGKRVGDVLAGTLVLQSRIPQQAGYVPPMPPPLAGWATTLDLSQLSDALALQCRQFLGRLEQLAPDARERLGASLVQAVQSTVTPPPPYGTPGWAYISAVLAERRRREEWRLQGLAPQRPQPPFPSPIPSPPIPSPPIAQPMPDIESLPSERPTGGFVPPS